MAKAKRKSSKPNTPTLLNDADDRVDNMFAGSRQFLRDQTSRENVGIPAGETTDMLVVLPMPALAPRMLFKTDGFVIGRVWELAGEEGSCKTALMNEIIRWHCIYGGGGHVAETENKDAATLRAGILEWRPRWLNRVDVSFCDSQEEWQSATTFKMQYFRDKMDDPKLKIGRTLPIVAGVDSLTAVDIQSNIDKVLELGHAALGYAQIANLIARYMRQGPGKLMRDYPFSLVVTNHMKPGRDEKTGHKTEHVVGGKSLPFASTIRIYMYRVADIDTMTHGGIRVKMKMQKNSAGASRGLPIECEMIWYREQIPGYDEPKKRFVWDWHKASIEALLRLENVEGKKTLFRSLMDICDIRAKKRDCTAWSKTLGIPESDPQHYRIVSQMLEQRPDLLLQMYPLLDIEVLPKFQAGVDYRTIRETADAAAAVKAQSLYESPEALPEIGGMRPTGRDLNEVDDVDPLPPTTP